MDFQGDFATEPSDTPAPRRIGLGHRIASVIAIVGGSYATVVAVQRVRDLGGTWELINPFSSLDPVLTTAQLLGILTPAVGFPLALTGFLALFPKLRRWATAFAVTALVYLLAWIVYLALLVAADAKYGGDMPAYWVGDGSWPHDIATVMALSVLALLVAALVPLPGDRKEAGAEPRRKRKKKEAIVVTPPEADAPPVNEPDDDDAVEEPIEEPVADEPSHTTTPEIVPEAIPVVAEEVEPVTEPEPEPAYALPETPVDTGTIPAYSEPEPEPRPSRLPGGRRRRRIEEDELTIPNLPADALADEQDDFTIPQWKVDLPTHLPTSEESAVDPLTAPAPLPAEFAGDDRDETDRERDEPRFPLSSPLTAGEIVGSELAAPVEDRALSKPEPPVEDRDLGYLAEAVESELDRDPEPQPPEVVATEESSDPEAVDLPAAPAAVETESETFPEEVGFPEPEPVEVEPVEVAEAEPVVVESIAVEPEIAEPVEAEPETVAVPEPVVEAEPVIEPEPEPEPEPTPEPEPESEPTPEPEPDVTEEPANEDAAWFVKIAGGEYGPYRWDQVRAFVTEGRIRPTTQVRRDTGEFGPAGEVCGLLDAE
ncbi:MAG: GYF domain-containing protein [Aeromicrobium sp.]|uniref:hypothetical protein n=1 Tax=Aeromicrobium sp. TaxID=1871063 RepID=UPI0039E5A444